MSLNIIIRDFGSRKMGWQFMIRKIRNIGWQQNIRFNCMRFNWKELLINSLICKLI